MQCNFISRNASEKLSVSLFLPSVSRLLPFFSCFPSPDSRHQFPVSRLCLPLSVSRLRLRPRYPVSRLPSPVAASHFQYAVSRLMFHIFCIIIISLSQAPIFRLPFPAVTLPNPSARLVLHLPSYRASSNNKWPVNVPSHQSLHQESPNLHRTSPGITGAGARCPVTALPWSRVIHRRPHGCHRDGVSVATGRYGAPLASYWGINAV